MKNSPTSTSPQNPSPSPVPMSPPAPEALTEQEREELTQLRRMKAELGQMLWEAVRIAAPETHVLELPPEANDPLWSLNFDHGLDGKIKLFAMTHKPITEQEKKRTVRFLRGTAKPMAEALAALELPHPPRYVEQQIATHLAWKDGRWDSVRPAGFGEKLKNVLHLPKQ